MNMKIDVDLSLLDEIDDPEIQNILKRFIENGFASFTNDRISNRISRAAGPLRKQKAIITAHDPRTGLKTIVMNDNIFNVDKLISSCWKNIINELK